MYLDFILDIAKVGDIINITTKEQTIEGEIMKISSSLIAIKKTNGAVVFCKDEDIIDLKLKATDKSSKEVKGSKHEIFMSKNEVLEWYFNEMLDFLN